MRGSSDVISTIMMTAVTIVIGLAFLSFLSGVLPGIAGESNRMSIVNEARSSVDAVLVYAGKHDARGVYVIDVMNVASSELTVYVSVVLGELGPSYPVVKGAGAQLYLMRAPGETTIERCLNGLPDCSRVTAVAPLSRIRLVDDIPLVELSSYGGPINVAKLTIGPRGSKTIVAAMPEIVSVPGARLEPILLVMVSHNGVLYLASYKLLPSE